MSITNYRLTLLLCKFIEACSFENDVLSYAKVSFKTITHYVIGH